MVTVETLSVAALLIAPGLLAVLIGVTLGVVEQKISRDKLYLTSFISSIFIDLIFIGIIQTFGGYQITDRASLEQVFFGTEQFNVGAAILLALVSIGLGVAYGLGLTYNISHYFREKIALYRSHHRNPWQPWVGGLRDADQVMVEMETGDDVTGRLAEFSRIEKERQLVLRSPVFPDFEDEPAREKLIITEDQITRVHVLTTREREGFWTRFPLPGSLKNRK